MWLDAFMGLKWAKHLTRTPLLSEVRLLKSSDQRSHASFGGATFGDGDARNASEEIIKLVKLFLFSFLLSACLDFILIETVASESCRLLVLLQELLLGRVAYLETEWKHALRFEVSFVIRGSVLDFVSELLLPDIFQVF